MTAIATAPSAVKGEQIRFVDVVRADLSPAESGHRRVLAVLRYLGT